MKLSTAVLSGLIGCFLFSCSGLGGYTEEAHTSFKAGPGFTLDDSTYFVLNYHLFRRPLGIRRFPDGGRVRTLEGAVYLMRLEEGRLSPILTILPEPADALSVMGVKGRRSGGELELLFVPANREEPLILRGGGEDFQVESSGSLADDTAFPLEGDLSITVMSDMIREIGPVAAGLPSPLIHSPKSDRAYIEDLIHLRGDLLYRKAVIRRLELSREEGEQILRRMDRHQDALEGYDLQAYRIYSEDTRREIQKVFSEPRDP